jgi:methylmalonyl-CoA mutase N-terminal domain/subunit
MPEKKIHTDSGIEIKTLYTTLQAPGSKLQAEPELPGQFPYTRGIQPDMYRGKLWTMRPVCRFFYSRRKQ